MAAPTNTQLLADQRGDGIPQTVRIHLPGERHHRVAFGDPALIAGRLQSQAEVLCETQDHRGVYVLRLIGDGVAVTYGEAIG